MMELTLFICVWHIGYEFTGQGYKQGEKTNATEVAKFSSVCALRTETQFLLELDKASSVTELWEVTARGNVALRSLLAPKLFWTALPCPHDAATDFWEVKYGHKSKGTSSGSLWSRIHVS